MNFDDVARSARMDLEDSVRQVPVPPPASPSTRRAVSVMALLALIAALVGLVVARNGAGEREVGFVDSGAPRYFVLDTNGTPYRATSVLDATTASFGDGLMAYFGDAAADDPFAERDALVVASSDEPLIEWAPNASVDGGPAQFRSGVDRQLVDRVLVNELWFELEGRFVEVASRHLSRDALIEFAERLRIDDDQIVLEGDEPGLVRLGTTVRSERQSVSYGVVTLETRRGGRDTLAQLRWFGAEPTEVDGRPGTLVRREATAGRITVNLAWLYDEGVILSISSVVSEAEARDLAARVREVDEAEWVRLRESVAAEQSRGPQSSSAAAPATSLPGRRSISGSENGVAWTYSEQNGNWCLSVPIGTGSYQSCMGERSTEAWATVAWLTRVAAAPVNGRNLSLLTTGEDVVAVAAVRPDGVRLDYRRLPDTLDDGRPLFIASVPEVAALPTDRAGSTVQAAVTFRDGTTIVVPVSIPELFRRTP